MLLPQADGDLGARLASGFGLLRARGHSPLPFIGSDTPNLPRPFFHEALTRCAEPGVDVVLGPSEDGGYYLIGLREPHPELFHDVPWSSERVAQETLLRAEKAGLCVRRLPRWFDVDTTADLARLARSVCETNEAESHTARWLRDLGGAIDQ